MKNFIGLLVSFCLGMSSLWAQPIVNLGADTTVCATTWTLQAGNAGASYLWNTGATTATLAVTSTGIYWVAVTDGTGTTRDSIDLTLQMPPVVSYLPTDTALCLGLQTLAVQATAGVVQWFDSTGQVLTTGDTLVYNLADTTRIWYQASNFTPLSTTLGLSLSSAATGYTAVYPRGVRFNLTEYVQLNSVRLDIDNGPFTAQIEIEDNAGNRLYTIPVSLPSAGQYTVALNVELPIGTGYTMVLGNIAGGQARFNGGVTPAQWSSYGNSVLEMVPGINFARVYGYFYDWQISILDTAGCSSGLDSILLNGLQTPVVALGNDTTLCGDSVLLNAFNTGASYAWSTGASSSSIFVSSSGTYQVTVSQGGQCAVVDSVTVTVLQPPTFISTPSDQNACQGDIVLVAQAATGIVQWFDSTGQVLTTGDTLVYNLADTTRIWYQASNFTPLSTTLGLSLSSAATGYAAVYPRGVRFNLTEYVQLNSVRLDIDNGPFTAQIEIEDNAGNRLYTIPVALPSAGQYTVALNVELPIGTGYTMVLGNIAGGQARFNGGVTPAQWSSYGNSVLEMVPGINFSQVYGYFYDWQISVLDPTGCSSFLDSVLINGLETPVIDLGSDTTLCSNSLFLNVSTPNSTYNWNIGTNAASIFVTTTGTYAVTVTQGGLCSDSDSIEVTILQEPNLVTIPSDQDVCEGRQVVLTAQADAGTLQWLDSTGRTVAIGDTFLYTVGDTARFWIQSNYYVPVGDTIGLPLSGVGTGYTDAEPRGVGFDALEFVRLNSVHLDIDNGPFTATIELEDANNTILYSVPVALPSAGRYRVALNLEIPTGEGYQLVLRNITGGQARFNGGVTPADWSSYGNGLIQMTEGAYFPLVYGYFYDWELATLASSCQSERDSFVINSLAAPVVALGQDTTLCSDSLLLAVPTVGGAYNWNTGSTSSSIFAASSGTYAVTVTKNGVCPISDSIQITVITQPQLIEQPLDQSACRGLLPLVVRADAGIVQWLDSTGTTFAVGDTLLYDLQDTTLLRYQAGYYQTSNAPLGLSLATPVIGYTNASSRGIRFHTTEYLRLNRVSLDIDGGPFTANIEIRDGQANLLYRIPVALPSAGQYPITLNAELPIGRDFTMTLENIAGGQARFDRGLPSWSAISLPALELVDGGQFPLVYGFFYEWEIALLSNYCASAMDSVRLDLLPTPETTLPADTVICNDSVLVDIAYPTCNLFLVV